VGTPQCASYLLAVCATLTLWLAATPARAITRDEIPDDVRRRLPEFLLLIVPPQALAALSVDDLIEYADAFEAGELHFVNEVRVEESSGPVTPDLAKLILQIPEGAPYIEARFLRMARAAYGNSIFSKLEWVIHENADTSVDIQLYYASNEPVQIIPDVGYSSLGGWLVGAQYNDFFYGGENKQLSVGAQLSENDTDEPKLSASYTDGTVNGGTESYSVSASVANNWRQRARGRDDRADHRERVARVDGSYSWKQDYGLTLDSSTLSVGAGLYGQDVHVYGGDPTAGAPPRSDFDQAGTGAYISVGIGEGQRDMQFTPREGRTTRVTLEQHGGDFPFTRVSADARKYIPLPNPIGVEVAEHNTLGGRNKAQQFFPAASLALQAQASLADGNVPWTQETVGSTTYVRGYEYDRYIGTKVLAARAEYRFVLDDARANEAFLFTDHALIGETLDDMEALDSWGFGGLFKLPAYGGFKLGAWAGYAMDGSDSSYGLAFGYMF
jgi:outer membrane protein assembly factor BamA